LVWKAQYQELPYLVAILVLEGNQRKSRLQNKIIQKEKGAHYTLIKGTIHAHDTTIKPNVGAPYFIKQILLDTKAHIDANTKIVGDFKTSLSPIDTSLRQKNESENIAVKNTTDQIDFRDFYRPLHPTAAEHTF
jgi:hypothetical protein